MKAWQVTQLGNPQEALQLAEVTKPEVGAKQVLVRVEAVALNFFDILLCQGKYQEKPPLPFTPGAEISGTIEAVGSEFKGSNGMNLAVGQRVLGTPLLPAGGLAEYVLLSDDAVFPIPDEMSEMDAAALFITYQTAYYALHRSGRLMPGETLLVHAGAGGVGSAAIQLGKAAGARVIATAGGAEKVEICRQLGADVAIDYLSENFADVVNEVTQRRGANVIFDPVGGDTFDLSRKCIAFEGRLLVIGFAGGRIADAPTNHALVKNYSIVGVHWGLYRKLYPQGIMDIHRELMSLYAIGKIKPLIYQSFNMDETITALNLLGERKTWGKLIVCP